MAWLSIRGLYLYDDSIFDGLSVPSGMDKTAIVGRILMECADLEILYPDWDTMYNAIRLWSISSAIGWDRAWTVIRKKYDPLWNVDARITETETRDLANAETRSGSGSGTDTSSGTDNGTNKLEVNAYNSSSPWEERERNTITNSSTDKRNTSYHDNETRAGTDTGTIKHETSRTGNIGVTSSQELLLKEMEVAAISVYDMIVEDFKRRFCLLVY